MTPQRPGLSLVVPTRDTRELTLACLASVRDDAPGGACEVIVVDDASRDGTAEAVRREHPGVRVLTLGSPQRFAAAANRGAREARGEVLLLLNSDTRLLPGSLAALLDAFRRDPALGVAGGALSHADGVPQWSGGREPTGRWLFALASGLGGVPGRLPGYRRLRPVSGGAGGPVDWVSGAALAVRRRCWEEAGPLDEGYGFYAQDADLCLAARARGWGVAVVPAFRVVHLGGATVRPRGEDGGVPFDPELLWPDLVRLAGKRGGRPGARRARRALALGTRLRLVGRGLAAPFLPPGRRAPWRRDSEAFHRAAAALATASGVEPGSESR